MPGTIEAGEQLYELTLRTTSMEDFGVSMAAIGGGQAVPPEGARIDAYVEGECTGKISGAVKVVDYLLIRPDGRIQLHIHGSIETPDGARISFSATGTGRNDPSTGLLHIRENIELHSSAPEYAWVNTISAWGTGGSDEKGVLTIKVYAADPGA